MELKLYLPYLYIFIYLSYVMILKVLSDRYLKLSVDQNINLSPMAIGFIYNGGGISGSDKLMMSALICSLGIKGHLQIEKSDNTFSIKSINADNEKLTPDELFAKQELFSKKNPIEIHSIINFPLNYDFVIIKTKAYINKYICNNCFNINYKLFYISLFSIIAMILSSHIVMLKGLDNKQLIIAIETIFLIFTVAIRQLFYDIVLYRKKHSSSPIKRIILFTLGSIFLSFTLYLYSHKYMSLISNPILQLLFIEIAVLLHLFLYQVTKLKVFNKRSAELYNFIPNLRNEIFTANRADQIEKYLSYSIVLGCENIFRSNINYFPTWFINHQDRLSIKTLVSEINCITETLSGEGNVTH